MQTSVALQQLPEEMLGAHERKHLLWEDLEYPEMPDLEKVFLHRRSKSEDYTYL